MGESSAGGAWGRGPKTRAGAHAEAARRIWQGGQVYAATAAGTERASVARYQALGGLTTQARGGDAPATLPIDIRQTDEAFVIEASVPGFAPEDVEVTVDQNVLTIRGNRKQEGEETKNGWIRRERRQSSVFRQIGLPAEVREGEITASFENGVLTVTVPRAQKAQPKRIPVKAGAPVQRKVIDAGTGES